MFEMKFVKKIDSASGDWLEICLLIDFSTFVFLLICLLNVVIKYLILVCNIGLLTAPQ